MVVCVVIRVCVLGLFVLCRGLMSYLLVWFGGVCGCLNVFV